MFRRFFTQVIFLVLFSGGLVAFASAEAPALLMEGIRKLQIDVGRWAFIQHQVTRNARGEIKDERIIRVDPSLRFDQREALISIEGREPTDKERESFQKKREKDQQRRERESWKGGRMRDKLNLDEASKLTETEESLVYEVPLVENKEQRFPPEKFQLLITVDRDRAEIREVNVRLREYIRAALVARFDRGEMTARFEPVDPTYTAPLVEVSGEGSGTILFVRVGASRVEKRTDFRRVTPWDERFSVDFGQLEFLGF